MIDLAIGLFAGFVIGAMFFVGLAWTVSRLPDSRHPALFASASFVVRTAVVVAVMMVLARNGATGVLAALAGLLLARTSVVRWVRSADADGEEHAWT